MTNYETIVGRCASRNEVWMDPEFPATQSSVFYFNIPSITFEWKRPAQIYSIPVFMLENPGDSLDIVTGTLGEKWILSCIGVLFSRKDLLYKVVPRYQALTAGIVKFRLWWYNEWVDVLVDDRLPIVQGELAFTRTTRTQQLWPALLEKALAKLYGSYEALKYGNTLDGLSTFTGGVAECLPMTVTTTAQDLLDHTQKNSIVTVVRYGENIFNGFRSITTHLNYMVLKVDSVSCLEGTKYLVQLGLPVSGINFGLIVLDDNEWTCIPNDEKNRIKSNEDGFWMLYTEFVKVFTRMEIVHLNGISPDQPMWQINTFGGSWKKGVNAGGLDFIHINPQIEIVKDSYGWVIISLVQYNVMEPKIIGFTIYKLQQRLYNLATANYLKKIKNRINSRYTNSRQITIRYGLAAGTYLIIPTTIVPNTEARFTLKVLTIKQIHFKVLDSTAQVLRSPLIRAPEVDQSGYTQYDFHFLQMADEQKTINVFDLQVLLDKCLPNDYVKSCATLDTCRQIVLSMDRSDSGRLTITDFRDLVYSLKYWQNVFREYALDSLGVLRVERLRDALRHVGFSLPEKSLSVLILKYMRKDGTLRFGDFVSAVLLVYRTFEFAAVDYLPIGILYLNTTGYQVICNTIHLRESWSLAPAHCVVALSDPGTAQLLPYWRIMYKTADLRYMVTKIKRSVAHPHFNRDDFSNNIGLLEHTISIPIHQYISFNISKGSHNYMESERSDLRLGEWDQNVLENKGAYVNPYNLYRVDTMDRAKCNSLMATVIDIRSYEYCMTLQQQSTVNILHGAALLEDYDVRGLFTWGEREGKTLPFIILNIANFKDWLLDVVILKSVNV